MKLIDLFTSAWAIVPEQLEEIRLIFDAHLKGPKIDFTAMKETLREKEKETGRYEVCNGRAIIPVKGIMMKSPSFLEKFFLQATDTLSIREDILSALDDSSIREILLHIDSPGGTVDGTQDLAHFIFDNRSRKPITAFTDGCMASAAYWVGSAASRVFIGNDTTSVGSIGVIMAHTDKSGYYRQNGITVTEIYSGKYKAVGSPNKALSAEDKVYLQERCDYLYSVFVSDVAKFRGVGVDDVLTKMADGRIFTGTQALQAKLADGLCPGGDPATIHHIYTTAQDDGERDMTQSENTHAEEVVIVEQLKEKYPDVYEAVFKLGEAHANEHMQEECERARAQGAADERERIKGVRGQMLPGYEELLEELVYDGKTTPEQAAMTINAAMRGMMRTKLRDMRDDSPNAQPASEPDMMQVEANEDKRPLDERTKDAWEKDAKLRDEFLGNFDSYLAFTRNAEAGRIRIKRS